LFSGPRGAGVGEPSHTGLPRHPTVISAPGAIALMPTCTGAPAARARSDGAKVLTKGTATATPPTAPAPQVMAIQRRRSGSMPGSRATALGASLMKFLWKLG